MTRAVTHSMRLQLTCPSTSHSEKLGLTGAWGLSGCRLHMKSRAFSISSIWLLLCCVLLALLKKVPCCWLAICCQLPCFSRASRSTGTCTAACCTCLACTPSSCGIADRWMTEHAFILKAVRQQDCRECKRSPIMLQPLKSSYFGSKSAGDMQHLVVNDVADAVPLHSWVFTISVYRYAWSVTRSPRLHAHCRKLARTLTVHEAPVG